jgi:hypothetical protein
MTTPSETISDIAKLLGLCWSCLLLGREATTNQATSATPDWKRNGGGGMAVASDGKLPVSKSLVASLPSSASVRSASPLLGPLATIITRLCVDPDYHHCIKTTAHGRIFITRLSLPTSVSVIFSETLPSQRLILGFFPFNSNDSIPRVGRIITKWPPAYCAVSSVPTCPGKAEQKSIRNGVDAIRTHYKSCEITKPSGYG